MHGALLHLCSHPLSLVLGPQAGSTLLSGGSALTAPAREEEGISAVVGPQVLRESIGNRISLCTCNRKAVLPGLGGLLVSPRVPVMLYTVRLGLRAS